MATTPDTSIETLFRRFLDVVNEAIDEGRDEFLFGSLLDLAEMFIEDQEIGVEIYRDVDGDEHVFDYFTIEYTDGEYVFVGHGKRDPDFETRLDVEYMEEVVDNADDYVDDPMKLDWDWIRSRMGMELD